MNTTTNPSASRRAFAAHCQRAIIVLLIAVIALASIFAIPFANAGKLLRYATVAGAIGALHGLKNEAFALSAPGVHQPPPAAASSCESHLPAGHAPDFADPKWKARLTTLCYPEYTVAFSGKTRTALWSAELLTPERLASARGLKRINSFFAETRIPSADRSNLKDFVGSGMDRGHLSPSGNASTVEAQAATFSLANMVPQNSKNNRGIWEGYESGVRNYVKANGALNVVTGPLYIGTKIELLNDRVAVPTHLWKLLYDPARKSGGVLIVENIDTNEAKWQSIADFEHFSGYQFKLGSPAMMRAPKPERHF